MKKILFIIMAFPTIVLFASLTFHPVQWGEIEQMPVAEALIKLGDEPPSHMPDMSIPGVSAERGEEIVRKGRTSDPDGGHSSRVSKHFVCTSCHNVERDEPDLLNPEPEGRLRYVLEKGLPYLQGSALYGAVDRRTYYNGDYEKKYGELVIPARNDLRNAIHLCATECAQGRALEPWEMESVLAYFWTIGLKLEDLDLHAAEQEQVASALRDGKDQAAAVKILKSKFITGFPATFVDPPQDRSIGYVEDGDPEKGKLIYELSCLHCHEQERYSFFNLDNSELSFEFMAKNIPTYSRYSMYQVVRYGTSPVPWKRAYMPHYTKEKMSDQMVEDLRSYIELQAQ